jgi:hypothetical protein
MHPSMSTAPARRRVSPGGLLRALTLTGAALVLVTFIWAGLVHAGVVRNPFAPILQGDIAVARGGGAGLRVLFVGNSFTYYNSMPELVDRLAVGDQGAPTIFVASYTRGGWTLEGASHDDRLESLLREVAWDVVVLQEQSQLLSFPAGQRRRETHPFAHALEHQISSAGGETVFFMTWGYRDGDPGNYPGDTYTAMQLRLVEGYSELGAELSAPVAPVGLAWKEALKREPGLDLWAGDGEHPNMAGSYLAASVFYAMLSGKDPSRSTFTGGLEPAKARFLRGVAWDVVSASRDRLPSARR